MGTAMRPSLWPSLHCDAMSQRPAVFVTVGTTKFDPLIRALDTDQFFEILRAKKCSSLTVQKGNGEYTPDLSERADSTLQTSCYSFKPNLAADLASSDIVISHAGAGSVLEALVAKKRLLVVVNSDLMDDHQSELAEAMESRGHLLQASSPAQLVEKFESIFDFVPKPLPPSNLREFAGLVDQEMGFVEL